MLGIAQSLRTRPDDLAGPNKTMLKSSGAKPVDLVVTDSADHILCDPASYY